MTQMTQTGKQVGSLRYRTTFRSIDRLTLEGAMGRLDALGELLYIATLVEAEPSVGSMLSGDEDAGYAYLRQMRAEFSSQESQPVVDRMVYGSPLDIWFHLSATAGVFYVAGNRALALYEKWQDIRIKRAVADRHELDALAHLEERLGLRGTAVHSGNALTHNLRRELRQQTRSAAAALDEVERFEALPED